MKIEENSRNEEMENTFGKMAVYNTFNAFWA